MLLRAQTSPSRPRPSGEPPIWLLRECLTRERMRSRSVSTQKPTHRRTPLCHADLAQSLRAEKVRKERPDCALTPREIYSRDLRRGSLGISGVHRQRHSENLASYSSPSASAWYPPLCCWNTPRYPGALPASTSLFSLLWMPTHSVSRPSSILANKLSPARGSP